MRATAQANKDPVATPKSTATNAMNPKPTASALSLPLRNGFNTTSKRVLERPKRMPVATAMEGSAPNRPRPG